MVKERYAKALNSVLDGIWIAGASWMETRCLWAPPFHAKTFGPQMSKVFRMNQVDVHRLNLGNLGCEGRYMLEDNDHNVS